MSLQHTEPQKVDRLWALPAVFGGMPLREPAKFDELGLGRFQGQAELSQPFAQGVLDARPGRGGHPLDIGNTSQSRRCI